MADDIDDLETDLDEDLETEDLAVEDIDEESLADDDLDGDDEFLDDDAEVGVEVDDEVVVADDAEEEEAPPRPAKPKRAGDDEEDDEEEADPDDVEADLDTILKDRIAAGTDDDEDEDEEEEPVPPGAEGTTKVQPRRSDEFLCESCFLVKPRSQLADPDLLYCNDCV